MSLIVVHMIIWLHTLAQLDHTCDSGQLLIYDQCSGELALHGSLQLFSIVCINYRSYFVYFQHQLYQMHENEQHHQNLNLQI
jgi:hypothetical protein